MICGWGRSHQENIRVPKRVSVQTLGDEARDVAEGVGGVDEGPGTSWLGCEVGKTV